MIGGQRGRSMIEMLGVLAIIGVLSVGGVAGYSKAMMKWKINKAVEEYNFLIQGLMEYKDNLVKSNPEVGQIKLGEFLKAANLVPDTWTTSDGLYMTDSMGNGNAPYLNNRDTQLWSIFILQNIKTRRRLNIHIAFARLCLWI